MVPAMADHGFFHSEPNPDKEPYTIVIPPLNVTGVLHMGHMLNNTIQDILIRKARMEGKEACWVPEQKITIEQALKTYTITGAYASFDEAIKGSLPPRKTRRFCDFG